MNQRISLDQVQITSPCTKNWDEMTGNDTTRFCEHCQKEVHNLSNMSRSQAEELICKNAGSLCVRYQPGANGQPLTLEYAPVVAVPLWKKWLPIATITGAAAFALIYLGLKKEAPKPTPMIMGDIAVPLPTPSRSLVPIDQP